MLMAIADSTLIGILIGVVAVLALFNFWLRGNLWIGLTNLLLCIAMLAIAFWALCYVSYSEYSPALNDWLRD
jgi:hypothetical protein